MVVCMGTGPNRGSYWENWSSKARRTSVMPGQEPLEHPIWTPSRFLYLEKDEGRAETLQRRQLLTVGALLCEDRESKEMSLLWVRVVGVCVEKVGIAGSQPAPCSVRIRIH